MRLNVVLDKKTEGEVFSFSVFNSDYSRNQLLMEQLVSTLVKYEGTGRYETFLAESWSTDSHLKVWSFKIKKKIFTEDGEEITAPKYKKCLERLSLEYSKSSESHVLKDLIGWDKFKKEKLSLEGIETKDDYTLVFKFNSPPSGFLEFLSMPYFGFYSEKNFTGIKWKDDNKIISSSKYKIQSSDGKNVVLKLRKDFGLNEGNEPEEIFIYTGDNKIINNDQMYIFENKMKDLNLRGAYLVESTPTVLNSIVLSPFKDEFTDPKTRNDILAYFQKNLDLRNQTFYYGFESSRLNYESSEKPKLKSKKLKVFVQSLNNNEETEKINKLLQQLEMDFNLKVDVDTPETLGSNWPKIALDNKKYHMRIARVDIGGAPENWVIDMMFCSKLGISFPDPTGSICNVVKKYKALGVADINTYSHEIFDAVLKTNTLLPIKHTGFSWFFSNNIDPKNLSKTMNIPRLDKIRKLNAVD